MTGEDLKRVQDGCLKRAKKILRQDDHLRPFGFVVTLHKHVDKIFEGGWGLEFIDPKECLRDAEDDQVAVLVLDLAMDYRRLYHAALNVFPQTHDVLPGMIALAESLGVDDPYMRTMRPFLEATQLEEKDVVAAAMRQICDKVDAFASIMQSEAWLRVVDASETVDQVYENSPGGLGEDKKSIEVIVSAMETYDFTRLVTVPIHRKASPHGKPRDGGKVVGFGEPQEGVDTPDNKNAFEGRMVRFLKPLGVAS